MKRKKEKKREKERKKKKIEMKEVKRKGKEEKWGGQIEKDITAQYRKIHLCLNHVTCTT